MIDGPTPLEIAQSPIGWWTRSEEFFTSGEILLKTRLSNRERWNTECVGHEVKPNDKEIRKLINIETPIVFNLAFSVELIVKAILVKQEPEKWVPEHGKIKFGHDIFKLIHENIGIELDDDEENIGRRIGDYVSYGKYPERVKPGDTIEQFEDLFNYHPYVSWSLTEFYEIISSLRRKLRDYFLNLVDENN